MDARDETVLLPRRLRGGSQDAGTLDVHLESSEHLQV